MEKASDTFTNQGYVHLPGFLDIDNCHELVNALNGLIAKGKTNHDAQCPKSEAIHGAPVFDSLLEQLVPNMEEATGKKLYPTYAYARLYKPGEVLKKHKDRPACEISATLTLGFDGKQWPIYMADGEETEARNIDKIEMDTGDMVVYRGCEKLHWRDEFKGNWQAQVFLHYVDQNGPHAAWKYDKRSVLSHHNGEARSNDCVSVVDAVMPEACPRIIAECEKVEAEQALIGTGEGKIDKTIRDVKRVPLPIHRGIGAAMSGIGFNANQNAWRFHVTHANQCEFLQYGQDGHYHAHVDTFMSANEPECRKLTVLLFLNDDFEGGRLYLQTSHDRYYPPQTPGSVLVFPSFQLHGVEPVTKGVRRSLVTWLVGPWFK